jgi:RNA polymerase-binding transcription factor DksA
MAKKEIVNKKAKKETSIENDHPNKSLHEDAHREFEKNQSSYGAEDLDYKLENNEVYDEAELASALESSMLSKALKDHAQKMAPQKHPNFDGLHCIDCEEEIHEGRLKMGRIRCTDCQEHQEYIDKRRGY